MQKSKTYCQAVAGMEPDNVHRIYHDTAYGFPLESDNELFGRLILEINQAGLSWTTILKKQDNFRKAYAGFNVQKVALFSEVEQIRLLNDAGIIRNRLKVDAAIFNAGKIIELQEEFGSFKNWLDEHHPKTKDEWVKLFKKTFRFTGGEITGEFLMSTGYLKGAHEKGCPVYDKVLRMSPEWSQLKKR